MSKHIKKKAVKSCKGFVIALVLIAVLLAVILYIMLPVSDRSNNTLDKNSMLAADEQEAESAEDIASNETAEEKVENEVAAITLPLLLEDGKLEIENIFRYDGLNPDYNNQEGSDIAAIILKNLSDTYLGSAKIAITTNSGEVLQFMITDIPAGKSTIALSADHASIDTETVFCDVLCETVFDPEASMNEEKVSVSVEGTMVTLKNNTDTEIKELVVYCRSTLGDQYFGGITYNYTVNNLPAGGTTEIDAAECILGLAEVVCVVIHES